jgi:hypothetical protein
LIQAALRSRWAMTVASFSARKRRNRACQWVLEFRPCRGQASRSPDGWAGSGTKQVQLASPAPTRRALRYGIEARVRNAAAPLQAAGAGGRAMPVGRPHGREGSHNGCGGLAGLSSFGRSHAATGPFREPSGSFRPRPNPRAACWRRPFQKRRVDATGFVEMPTVPSLCCAVGPRASAADRDVRTLRAVRNHASTGSTRPCGGSAA